VRDGVQAIASSCRTDAASPKLRAALSTFQEKQPSYPLQIN
jgi:guanylate kinase